MVPSTTPALQPSGSWPATTAAATQPATTGPASVLALAAAVDVRQFAAKADGNTDDTAAFQAALDAAAKAGGGTVARRAGT